jgi:protocatechuate 3,4-dioxygenase, alpha subunit
MSLGPTPSQTSGPLFGFALMFEGSEQAVDPSAPDAVEIEGTVIEAGDAPFEYPECFIEVWQGEQFARARTDERGGWRVCVRKPDAQATVDGQTLAPHLNVTLFGRGLLKQAQTRMYFPDEEAANERDPVLALVPDERRHTLIARSTDAGLRFDVHLQGDDETVFFDFE